MNRQKYSNKSQQNFTLFCPEQILKIQKIWAALRYITLTYSHKIWLCPVLKEQDFKSRKAQCLSGKRT